jgi:hypothetical protein
MASQATIDERKAILRARGVPDKFIDNIARQLAPSTMPP